MHLHLTHTEGPLGYCQLLTRVNDTPMNILEHVPYGFSQEGFEIKTTLESLDYRIYTYFNSPDTTRLLSTVAVPCPYILTNTYYYSYF